MLNSFHVSGDEASEAPSGAGNRGVGTGLCHCQGDDGPNCSM